VIVSHTWSDPFFLAIVDLNHQTKTRPIKRPRKDPGGGHVPCVEKSGRGHGEACVRGVFRPSREDGGLDRSPAWVGPGLWAARRDRFSAGRSDAPAWSAARSGGSGDATTSPPGGRWSWSRVESSRVESSLQLLASFCGTVTCMLHVGRGVAKAFGYARTWNWND